MTEYTFDENTVSDLHKDAYGFRPSQGFWAMWNSMNDDGKQSEWDSLIDAMEASVEFEKVQQAMNIKLFEEIVVKTIAAGAADRATAYHWIMEASPICNGDWEFLCWEYGIPYGYFNKV